MKKLIVEADMIVERGRKVARREGGRGFEIIIHIKDVGQKTLGGGIYLLHLALYLNCLQAELFPRS